MADFSISILSGSLSLLEVGLAIFEPFPALPLVSLDDSCSIDRTYDHPCDGNGVHRGGLRIHTAYRPCRLQPCIDCDGHRTARDLVEIVELAFCFEGKQFCRGFGNPFLDCRRQVAEDVLLDLGFVLDDAPSALG